MDRSDLVRVGVIGASGYSGAELVRILANHPRVNITYLAGNRTSGTDVVQMLPHLAGRVSLPNVQKYDAQSCAADCDIAFVALPSGVSGQVAAELWARGLRVVDLSGDLRLPAATYQEWYGREPSAMEAQQAAVYGLTEWRRPELMHARLVANPGCYATAVLLALLPAVRSGLHRAGLPLIADAKSGITGAGRTPSQTTHLGELSENFYPYKVGRHQHTPEIEQELGEPLDARLLLTTQLLPTARGLYAVCYISLARQVSWQETYDIYRSYYADEPFIVLTEPGHPPQVKHVRASNQCRIGLHVDDRCGLLQVFSVIDNLQKGAAGQAVQNFNVMCGFPETDGLQALPLFP